MDAAERRRILFEKITANNQRRKRDDLLQRLPPSLAGVLGDSPCIYSVEIDPILRGFVPFKRSGVGSEGFLPPHYEYAEVAWESKMLASTCYPPACGWPKVALFCSQADVSRYSTK